MDVLTASFIDFVKVRLYDYFKSDNIQHTTTSVVMCITVINLILKWFATLIGQYGQIFAYYHLIYYKIYPPIHENKKKYKF